MCKFQIGMEVIKFIKKLSELLFPMSPYRQYNGATGKVVILDF